MPSPRLLSALSMTLTLTACIAAVPPSSAQSVDGSGLLGNRAVLSSLEEIPSGGGYSTSPGAVSFLEESAGAIAGGFRPAGPGESFCSSATYLVLLSALKKLELGGHLALPELGWESLAEVRLADGHGAWGSWNANGPGAARFLSRSGLGYAFADYSLARPGDFLKFFWTGEIGRSERGHLVVFLGFTDGPSGQCVRYWSSNKPEGMGVREVPLAKMKNLIFARLSPSQSVRVPSPEDVDDLLVRMGTERFGWASVREQCLLR